ncbi:hypothetical protein RFI_02529 [Reticulomyxa filosa]|uniref:Uncharacterized protein n=1 Tax=Reticulomyxa filosa TaxID=46433 RepID=X6P8X5_RETFI|nr:hypothetical protein RFI_02529 [Reticulomyxa filosa]|eukprot:ETO34563.1 hypothetical protein RFI_02529 [Reticulomyxa filosa]
MNNRGVCIRVFLFSEVFLLQQGYLSIRRPRQPPQGIFVDGYRENGRGQARGGGARGGRGRGFGRNRGGGFNRGGGGRGIRGARFDRGQPIQGTNFKQNFDREPLQNQSGGPIRQNNNGYERRPRGGRPFTFRSGPNEQYQQRKGPGSQIGQTMMDHQHLIAFYSFEENDTLNKYIIKKKKFKN